ncbi:hypothetical protein [Glutamicibacter sp. HZAU]|uniref:hypothetical protein n=1 Tax=Glutamicibacter sp. HZAU TaxID=2049891 RepID=UPI000FFB84E8|nr:hypothetical protein [Glutamicibacter sp. HZAU]RWZ83135.1 hypothetical protein EKH49_11895 [Glutamicibacter sp. HZAU]
MPVVRKPGADALVYFWFAVGLSVLGVVVQQIGTFLMLNATLELNVLEVTTLHLVAWGCYTGAAIFTIVVMHKALAMLIYLVHHHRPLPPHRMPVIRDAPVTAQSSEATAASNTSSGASDPADPLGSDELPSGSKPKTFPRQALGALPPQNRRPPTRRQNPGKDNDPA